MAQLPPKLRSFVALLVLAPLFAAVGEWHVGHGGYHGPLPEVSHTGLAAPGDGALTAPRDPASPADCPACLHQLRAGAATLPAVAPLPAYAVALAPEAAPAIASGWRAMRAADARGPPAAG